MSSMATENAHFLEFAMSFERCKHSNLVSKVLPCRECDLEVESLRLRSELEHSQRCRNNQEVQGVKNRERIRELEAEVAKLREGNETWRQIAKAREARVYSLEKELEKVKRERDEAKRAYAGMDKLRNRNGRQSALLSVRVEERNSARRWAKAWKIAAKAHRGWRNMEHKDATCWLAYYQNTLSVLKDALDVIEQWEDWRQYTSAPMNGVSPSLVEKTIAKIKKALG